MKYLKDILYPFCSAIPAQTTFAEAPIRVAFPVGQARVVKENNAACYECYTPYVGMQNYCTGNVWVQNSYFNSTV